METFPEELKTQDQDELDEILDDDKICKFRKLLAVYYHYNNDSPKFGFKDFLDRLQLAETIEIEVAKKFYINNNWNVIGSVNLDHLD